MTHTTTMVGDHLGMTTPKVFGNEYCVLAKLNITKYQGQLGGSDNQLEGTVVAADNTFTVTSGNALSAALQVGQSITTSDFADGNNNGAQVISAISGDTFTVSSLGTNVTSAEEFTIEPVYELLTASEFGLSRITAIDVLAQENVAVHYTVRLGTDGEYTLNSGGSTHVELMAQNASGANHAQGDLGYVLVRVYGVL